MHKPPYPSEIIVKKEYKKSLNTQELLRNYPILTVVRRCGDNGSSEDIIPNNPIGLSVILVGGKYEFEKHSSFNPTNKELTYKEWDGEYIPQLPIPEENYEIKTSCYPMYFRVSEIDGMTIPYCKNIHETEYESIKAKGEDIRNKEDLKIQGVIVGVFKGASNGLTEVHARIHVNHHPNIFNYWHFQFDCYEVDSTIPLKYEDADKRDGKRIKRKIRQEFQSMIDGTSSCCRYNINRKFYQKKSTIYERLIDAIIDKYYSLAL